MATNLIIFDFDGVIADSEVLACGVAAEYSTELGVPMSLEAALATFMGKRVTQVQSFIELQIGRNVAGFSEELEARTLALLGEKLQPVPGALKFIEDTAHLAQCIASSSTHQRLAVCLKRLGLQDHFAGRVFSADDVSRGKPFPDLLLHAAAKMGIPPSEAMVIEDSLTGVKAGVAANMVTIGILAGSHIGAGHGSILRSAGATQIVHAFDEILQLL